MKKTNGMTKAEYNRDMKEAMANTARLLWNKACEFDGIDRDAKFVVFSDENPFAKKYNRLMLHQCMSVRPDGVEQ